MLFEVGYCVAWKSCLDFIERILSLGNIKTPKTANIENNNGIRTIRLNDRASFGLVAINNKHHAVHRNNFMINYGQPYSISEATTQPLKYLLSFFTEVLTLINEKKLQIILPGDSCNY